MWYELIRPLLFSLDPEFSHDFTLKTLKVLYRMGAFRKSVVKSPTTFNYFGLNFANPIGLAAGLDKNGECIPAWGALGFGFIEVGTVTPKGQAGNPKPRLFRLPRNQALINRMGFNNKGIDYLISQLKSHPVHCPVGVNIGKNRDTSLDQAASDYLLCFQKIYPFADYVTVNLSSPNTPGLKSLQHGEMLRSIIIPLKEEQKKQSDSLGKKVPILVKISPDLTKDEVKHIIDDLISLNVEGVIATNTTTNRPSNLHGRFIKEAGGLSGEPLLNASTEMIKLIYQQAGNVLPLIAVGGIFNAAHVKEKFAAGAKLIQLYTGLIYRGPSLIKEILKTSI